MKETTLTIRKLAAPVKRKLRLRAAAKGHSMEAEARAILTNALMAYEHTPAEKLSATSGYRSKARGLWSGRGSTDALMETLRGE